MVAAKLKVDVLYAALDAERRARGLSWRQVAGTCGLSPSTLSRLANGHKPDVDAFGALVGWLNQPAEVFLDDGQTDEPGSQPDLVAQLAPLLRARQDLAPQDVTYLEDVISAAVRRFASERES